MQIKILLVVFAILLTGTAFAQSRKSKNKAKPPAQSSQPTTLDPLSGKNYAPKTSKKSSKGPTYESEQQFYDRMAQLEKTRRKNEALQQKPQYSDPMYFGHKRPPKKRKPGKMKYCKECGLRH